MKKEHVWNEKINFVVIVAFMHFLVLNVTYSYGNESRIKKKENHEIEIKINGKEVKLTPTPKKLAESAQYRLIANTGNPTATPTLTNAEKRVICKNHCVFSAGIGVGGCGLVGALAIIMPPVGFGFFAACSVSIAAATALCWDHCNAMYP